MRLLQYRYLTQDQLRRFDSYKYAAIDTSPISQYVMHPFWNFIVEFIPTWVAPNVLTLAGFGCTLMNAILLSYYDYHFFASSDSMRSLGYSPIPSVVWLICAINLFLAHTLDGIDGKQARRTKATGPLGELMDHGVDSWTAVFVPLYIYSLFGSVDFSIAPNRMYFVFWSVFFTFYLTHWEKYNTGVLYLPWSYDLSQIFLFACSLVTFFTSYQIWKTTFPFTSLPFAESFELLLYGSIFVTLPLPLYNVYSALKSGKSKYSTLGDVMRPMPAFVQLFIVSTLWIFLSPSNILDQDPRIYLYTVGTIFSNIASRLIISQMSSSKSELYNGLTVTFSVIAFCSVVMPMEASTELLLLRVLALALTLAHLHYAINVIHQMCEYLNLRCLSLRKRSTEISREHLLSNSDIEILKTTTNNGNQHPDSQQPLSDRTNTLIYTTNNSNGAHTMQRIEDGQLTPN